MIDGISFDSKKEAKRYRVLLGMQQVGIISGLRLQVRFKIKVNNQLICTYVADFVYVHKNKLIVEDVKGLKTSIYKLKKRLMKTIHNIEIFET